MAYSDCGIAIRGLGCLVAGLLYTASGMAIAAPVPLFKNLDSCPIAIDKQKVLDCARASVNFNDVLANNTTELSITLPGLGNMVFQRVALEKVKAGQFIWRGRGKAVGNRAVLSVVGSTAVGTITVGDQAYRLRVVKGNTAVIERLNTKYFLVNEPSSSLMADLAGEEATCVIPQIAECGTDGLNTIDVLVLYTQAALTNAGTLDALVGWINHAISESNTSFTNSGVPILLKVVEPVPTEEDPDPARMKGYIDQGVSEDLKALKDACGQLRAAHDLREATKADVVVLLTNIPGQEGGGGEGETMLPYEIQENAFQSEAYAVVQLDQLMSHNFVLTHELGHIMGSQHDGTAGGAFPFSHGHIDLSPIGGCALPGGIGPWGTVMTASSCCKIIPFWSNPGSSEDSCGEPMGNTTTEFNAESLRRTALSVANFRCSAPIPADVWMKDGWSDTGKEPDPAMMNQAMSQSPYIWVRNSQDPPPHKEAHQHQNPIAGVKNYVYVKIHNSLPAAGGIATGTLEVGAANASTALTMGSFSPIGTADPSNFQNGTTRIIEIPWTPTNSGHYCLMARWLAPNDPINASETSSVSSYVRSSNNVIWRNMNIVELEDDEAVTAVFEVANIEPAENRFTLHIRPVNADKGFLSFGQVFLHMDSTLQKALKKANYVGTGILLAGNSIQVKDKSGGTVDLVLDPKSKGKAEITFSRKQAGDSFPRGEYKVDVVQTSKSGPVGEIRYEIRTYSVISKK